MDRASTPVPTTALPSRQNTPLHGKLFGHTSSSSVSSLGNTKTPQASHDSSSDSSDSSDDTNASTSIYYESENDTRGRNPTPVLPTLLRRRSSLSASSSRRSSISEAGFAKSPTMEEWNGGGGGRSRRPSLLSTPSRDTLVQPSPRDLSRDPFLSRITTSGEAIHPGLRRDSFNRGDFQAPRDSNSPYASRDSHSPFHSRDNFHPRDPPITPSIGSPSLAATSPAESPLLPEMAIRMVSANNRKNMKPKPKSFLRISRDLVEENAPLDSEMRHESAITCALREDAVEESGMARDTAVLPARDVPYPNYIDYFEHVIDEHSDSDTARPKRKRVAGDYDPVLKRRAVSPGLSSPIMSASPTGAKRSNRQVQDTSEEIQRMTL